MSEPWVLTFKNGRSMPMCKYRGRSGDNRWFCRTFNWKTAKFFSSKEEAIDYLDKYFLKYPKSVKRVTPIKLTTLLRRQSKEKISEYPLTQSMMRNWDVLRKFTKESKC